MNTINSLNNQKIKDIVRLKKSGERKDTQTLIIDGAREIEMAKKNTYGIKELFYCPTLIKKEEKNFFGIEKEKIIEVSEAVFRKVCYKENPDGYFAVASAKNISLSEIKLSEKPLIIILESVEKPGNLGAIIRTAFAAGVEAIVINDNQTDIYNPNVIRASEGFVFKVPILSASVEDTQKWLKKEKILSLAAATGGKNNYTEENMNCPVALVLGSEADGLSEKWLKKSDKIVTIAMSKGIDSLNVSVSGAILIYEALRQRTNKGGK